jgi:hypothetical protein
MKSKLTKAMDSLYHVFRVKVIKSTHHLQNREVYKKTSTRIDDMSKDAVWIATYDATDSFIYYE